jgi:chromosome segregation and condensation protein ScpB
MATKPECHDAVRLFVKSIKPPLKLSLPALETLAVIAYKQPVTAPEVNDIRGVDTSAVFGTLLSRKLITTAGRKAGPRPAHPLQNHPRVPAPLRPQGRLRAALHGGVREAGRY